MYILEYNRQIDRINEMTQLRSDSESWEVYYHDPSSNLMWKSFFPLANGQKRGPKLLRIDPVPENREQLIERCLSSELKEDAIGLGIEFSANPHSWQQVLRYLEENYREFDRRQLKRFLKALGVETPAEVIKEAGHEPQEYGFDEKALKELVRRSRKLRYKSFWVFW